MEEESSKKSPPQAIAAEAAAPSAAEGASCSSDPRSQEKVTEDTVTMVDILKEENELEEDAKAVLGGADERICTYMTGGYMKRQPLYSCLTCIPAASASPAGMCLACSYHCHEGHDLVELYTKRDFRCDCGNKKFQAKCRLEPDKVTENDRNRYDHNFSGTYCTCDRPYPDPDDAVSDEMIQCVICEDWYHGRHLGLGEGVNMPEGDAYAEMICRQCVEKHNFLNAYKDLAVNCEKANASVDVEGEQDDDKCPVENSKVPAKPQTLFMESSWRCQLCKCAKCTDIYRKEKVEFLTDEEDTVHHYEAQSKSSSSSQYEEGMKALSAMERVQQVEAIHSYNQMKGNLMNYLKKFAENGKVVKQEDIQEFFEGMQQAKRRKLDIPKFCR